jgi:hypothetical protein
MSTHSYPLQLLLAAADAGSLNANVIDPGKLHDDRSHCLDIGKVVCVFRRTAESVAAHVCAHTTCLDGGLPT